MNSTSTVNSRGLSAEGGTASEGRADKTAFAYAGIILFTYRIFTGFIRNFQESGAGGAVINAVFLSILMLAAVKITMSLCRYTGSINLLEMCGENLGGISKTILGVLALIFIVISASNTVIEFSKLSKVIAFKTAPPAFLVLFFALTVWISGRSKLTAVLGVFSVTVPVIIIMLALLFLTSLRYSDLKNFFPLFSSGINDAFIKGFGNISIYSDFILLLLSQTAADKKGVKELTRSVENAALAGAVINILAVLVITLCTAYPFSKDISNPLYHIVEIVYYGRFFQRVDGFYMLAALIYGLLYISYLSNIAVGISAELFNFKNKKLLSLLYAVLIMILGCTLRSRQVNDMINSCMRRYSFIFGIILPLALMVIFRLKGGASKQEKRDQT